ncbi:MAG: zinc ribbon domain-containing protein [Desulfobacterales bacterium]
MPFVEFKCSACAYAFSRLVFKGDESPQTVCPRCGSDRLETAPTSESLFGGIASFSGLATDVN